MNEQGPIDLKSIFSSGSEDFEANSLSLFMFQYQNNPVYRQYCNLIKCNPTHVCRITDIPFLPIAFFKNRVIKTTEFSEEIIFESSKTTGTIASRHFVKDVSIYIDSYLSAFQSFYGDVDQYCIIGLLPSYLERENSSLVFMVNDLIKRSKNKESGFYLQDFQKLYDTLKTNEANEQRTLLIGVTFALLDFASEYPLPLFHTKIIETGGMKGRKKEMTRDEVHNELRRRFKTATIHSEYGMTELLSQAYAIENGIFKCPPWMKMLVREADDPFAVKINEDGLTTITGLGNIIDLANKYSCAFIATDDVVKLSPDNTFEILGRADNSDSRGCSLMTATV